MKYHTSTIPLTLAEKLKGKGMPMKGWQGWAIPFISVTEDSEDSEYDWLNKGLWNEPRQVERQYSVPTYAEVLDWLMSEKNISVIVYPIFEKLWQGDVLSDAVPDDKRICYETTENTWHEAANAAIEKALTLI